MEEYRQQPSASQPMSAGQYTLDNGMGTATVMSAEQYSSGAIHSIGEFPAPAMSAEQVEAVDVIKGFLDSFRNATMNDRQKDAYNDAVLFLQDQHFTAPTVKADGWVEQAKNSFELIVKWCEDSGLKQCDIGNKKHMAIYHSLHAAKDALNNFPVCTIPSPRQENKVSKSIE